MQTVKKKKKNKPLTMTPKDEQDFKSADSCHICDKKYVETDFKVRDLK